MPEDKAGGLGANPSHGADPVIRAAGVVILRDGAHGPETLIVHRPGRGDWSLPKGKLKPGEHALAAATRECDEETGFQVTLGAPLESARYLVTGRPKVVDYWIAHSRGEEGFIGDEKIDEVRWLPVAAAAAQLTYRDDARRVKQAALLPTTVPLVLLRHTAAVKRSDFRGKPDAERPLSGRGRSQAKALVGLLDSYGLVDVHSSDATRCHDSVRKLAKSLSTGVQQEHALSEEGFAASPERAAKRMRRLTLEQVPLVVCSHRPVLPTLLESAASVFGADATGPLWDPKMPPGGFIVLHRSFSDGQEPTLVAIERHTVD